MYSSSKRLPFPLAAIVFVGITMLPPIVFLELFNMFGMHLPNSVGGTITILSMWFATEVVSLVGPKPFETLMQRTFNKLSRRDIYVGAISLGTLCGFMSIPADLKLQFQWTVIAFVICSLIGVAISAAICYLFGSSDFKRDWLKWFLDPRRNPDNQ